MRKNVTISSELLHMLEETTTFGSNFFSSVPLSWESREISLIRIESLEHQLKETAKTNNANKLFYLLDEYIASLEEIELSYSAWKKEHYHEHIAKNMQDTLERVKMSPHEVILEKKHELADIKEILAWFHTKDGSVFDRYVYTWLFWLEIVVISLLIRLSLWAVFGVFAFDEKYRLLVLFIGIVSLALYVLRKTKYTRWLLVAISFLCIYVFYLRPRLT